MFVGLLILVGAMLCWNLCRISAFDEFWWQCLRLFSFVYLILIWPYHDQRNRSYDIVFFLEILSDWLNYFYFLDWSLKLSNLIGIMLGGNLKDRILLGALAESECKYLKETSFFLEFLKIHFLILCLMGER